MSRVPTAVRNKAKSVDDMIRANAAASEGIPADVEGQATEQEPNPGVESAQTADIVEFEQPSSATDEGGDTAETTSMADAALETLDLTAQEKEDYKQRWKSLHGQLRQRDAQLEQQADQIARLTELVGQMAEGAAAAPAQPEPQAPVGVLSTDADDFGEEWIELITRISTAVVNQALQGVTNKVQNLEHNVQDVNKSTSRIVRKSFEETLTELAPRWREFDTDQGFHDWLDGVGSRRKFFTQAVSDQDAEGVADYFNMFVATLPAPQPSRQEQAQNELEKQVAPKRSSAAPTPVSETTEPKLWTRTEIATNYRNRANGKINDKKWAALEVEMTSAQNEGRVDYTR